VCPLDWIWCICFKFCVSKTIKILKNALLNKLKFNHIHKNLTQTWMIAVAFFDIFLNLSSFGLNHSVTIWAVFLGLWVIYQLNCLHYPFPGVTTASNLIIRVSRDIVIEDRSKTSNQCFWNWIHLINRSGSTIRINHIHREANTCVDALALLIDKDLRGVRSTIVDS
jgi:hypothetical protein